MAEVSYHEKMAKEAELRARVLYTGRADRSRSPKIFVEPSRRREVEAFAAKLRDVQPPTPDPERGEYARMDAAAMVQRLAGDDAKILADLQAAVLSQDFGIFLDVLDTGNIGSKVDRANLQHFIAKQDALAIAACIRILARGAEEFPSRYEEDMGLGQVDIALEKVNHCDPIVGYERRMKMSTFLRGNDFNNPAPFRRPPDSQMQPETFSALELGDECEDWERDIIYHPSVLDSANVACNLREEAAQCGHLDGRIDGCGLHPGWNNWGSLDTKTTYRYMTTGRAPVKD